MKKKANNELKRNRLNNVKNASHQFNDQNRKKTNNKMSIQHWSILHITSNHLNIFFAERS